MANEGTLETLVVELTRILDPLVARLKQGQLRVLMAELGYPLSPAQEAALAPAAGSLSTAVEDLSRVTLELIEAVEADDDAILENGVEGTLALASAMSSFADLANAVGGLGLGGVSGAEIDELPERLFSYLVVTRLDSVRSLPELFELSGVLGRTVHNPDSTDPNNPEYTVSRFHFDRLLGWLTDAAEQLRSLYAWGQPSFDGSLLLPKIEKLIAAAGLPVVYHESEVPPRLDAVIFELSAPPALNPRGLRLGFGSDFNSGEVEFPGGDVTVTLSFGVQAATGAGLIIQPNGNIELVPPDPGTQISGEIKLGVTTTGGPYILLGQTGGSRLELGGIGVEAGTRLSWVPADGKATGTFRFEARAEDGKVVIDATSGDGFLTKIIPGAKFDGTFDLGLGYSTDTGFYVSGSGSLEVRLPLHVGLGPITFEALTISVTPRTSSVDVGLGADISALLGPLAAIVENVGVKAMFSFPPDGGNLGPVQLDIDFLPPKGVGLSLDVGVVKGGGYLFIDTDRGEYAGALELMFADIVALKAIGIITTRMPDGSKGFSLLIIISVEFGSGIQLGFGFTLLAVGGLLGLNRSMNLQALMEGVRSGAIESIMFPRDVIANAPRIISDLRAFFPPQEGTFLIGPMAKLGWGTPTLISVSLGIIIEIPGNIAILGILKVALPTEDAALILLQVNFAGAIEFDKKRLYFFAALFESRVVFLTLEGELGLLVAFGDDANFVVSVGGFHPRFSPPPLPFPSPRRIAINILNTPIARIRVEGYFAVTSNTVQFGARAEVYFNVVVLTVEGHLAFDALFQFSPFYFVIEISASFSVKVFGLGLFSVGVSGLLEGPTPWHVLGHGSISLLFWDIDVEFETTWGESRDTQLPPIAVMPLLQAELDKPDTWRALLPASSNLLVSLRKLPSEEAALTLHPLGVLHVSQRALPLDLKLDKVGSQKPADVNRLSIAVTGGGLAKKGDALEQFAPAQFQDFSDADKLSRPAFAPEHSGLDLSASGNEMRSSVMVKRIVRYEEIIIDSNFKRFQRGFRSVVGLLFDFFTAGAAVSRSPLSKAAKSKVVPFEEKVSVAQETYTVALQSNNKALAADAASFHSEASARDYMQRRVAENAHLADELHVIPSHEKAA